MYKTRPLKILMADDEATIAHIYAVGLPTFFSPANGSSADELEAELFGSVDSGRSAAELVICRQGGEAVDRFREALESGDAFDIVVLDICMPPGIDGVEAAKKIRALDSGVRILFVSGYSEYSQPKLRELLPPPSRTDFMKKPVKLADLANRIVELTQPTVPSL